MLRLHKKPILVPVDTGRKLNPYKAIIRRPGRLLNVLCMFDLRPVSTGVMYLFYNLHGQLSQCHNFVFSLSIERDRASFTHRARIIF